MLVPKACHFSFVQGKAAYRPTFLRSSSDSLRTESQIQRHFDVETDRFAKLFIKAGLYGLSLFIPKRTVKLF